jgi:glucose-1-phosphate thymidylyltransferase
MGDVVNLLGSGAEFGLDLTYRVQDQPGGIAQALGLCENFVGDDPFVVILGDNILAVDIADDANAYVSFLAEHGGGARVLLKEVHDPERYGVPEIADGRITRIIEKPSNPPSNYCVTGVYFYDSEVFDIIRTLRPSGRGELEVTDVNNAYVSRGSMTYGILNGWWGDAGTIEGWNEANELALDLVYEELAQI